MNTINFTERNFGQDVLRKIHNVNVVNTLNYDIDGSSDLFSIKINSGNFSKNDLLSLEGVSFDYEEFTVDENGTPIDSTHHTFGNLSKNIYGQPYSSVDVSKDGVKIGNNFVTYSQSEKLNEAEQSAYILNQEYEEILYLMNEINSRLFSEDGEQLSKTKLKDFLSDLSKFKYESQFNSFLEEVSNIYNSYIDDSHKNLSRVDRAFEIIGNGEFQSDLDNLCKNFEISVELQKAKKLNNSRDVYQAKFDKLESIVDEANKFLELRAKYNELQFPSRHQKKRNSECLKNIHKEFDDVPALLDQLKIYQEKILKGTLLSEDEKVFREKFNLIENKLTFTFNGLLNLDAAYSMSEAIGREKSQANYYVSTNRQGEIYSELISVGLDDLGNLTNRVSHVNSIFKDLKQEYNQMTPTAVSNKIRKENEALSQSISKLVEEKKSFTDSTSEILKLNAKGLSKNERADSFEKFVTSSIDTLKDYERYLYVTNTQSGNFELLRHLSPKDKVRISHIMGEHFNGVKNSVYGDDIVFKNQKDFIQGFLAYVEETEKMAKNYNFNEIYESGKYNKATLSSLDNLNSILNTANGLAGADISVAQKSFDELQELNRTKTTEFIKEIKQSLFNGIDMEGKKFDEISKEISESRKFSDEEKAYLTDILTTINKENVSLYELSEVLDKYKSNSSSIEAIFNQVKESEGELDKKVGEYLNNIDSFRSELKEKGEAITDVGRKANFIEHYSTVESQFLDCLSSMNGTVSSKEESPVIQYHQRLADIDFVQKVFFNNLNSVQNQETFDRVIAVGKLEKYLPKDASFDDLKTDLVTLFKFRNNIEQELNKLSKDSLGEEKVSVNETQKEFLERALRFLDEDCLSWRKDTINIEGHSNLDTYKYVSISEDLTKLESIQKQLKEIEGTPIKEQSKFLRGLSDEEKLTLYNNHSEKFHSKKEELSDEEKVRLFDKSVKIGLMEKDVNLEKSDLIRTLYADVKVRDLKAETMEHILNASDVVSKQTIDENYVKNIETSYKQLMNTLKEDIGVNIEGLGAVSSSLIDTEGRNLMRYVAIHEAGVLDKDKQESLNNVQGIDSRFLEILNNSSPEHYKETLEKLKSDTMDKSTAVTIFHEENLRQLFDSLDSNDKKIAVYQAFETFVAEMDKNGYSDGAINQVIHKCAQTEYSIVLPANELDSYTIDFFGDKKDFRESCYIQGQNERSKSFDNLYGDVLAHIKSNMQEKGSEYSLEDFKSDLRDGFKTSDFKTGEVADFIRDYTSFVKEHGSEELSLHVDIEDFYNSKLASIVSEYKSQDAFLVNLQVKPDTVIPLNPETLRALQTDESPELRAEFARSVEENLGFTSFTREDFTKILEMMEGLSNEKTNQIDSVMEDFREVFEAKQEQEAQVTQPVEEVSVEQDSNQVESVNERIERLNGVLSQLQMETIEDWSESKTKNPDELNAIIDSYRELKEQLNPITLEGGALEYPDDSLLNKIETINIHSEELKSEIIESAISGDKFNFDDFVAKMDEFDREEELEMRREESIQLISTIIEDLRELSNEPENADEIKDRLREDVSTFLESDNEFVQMPTVIEELRKDKELVTSDSLALLGEQIIELNGDDEKYKEIIEDVAKEHKIVSRAEYVDDIKSTFEKYNENISQEDANIRQETELTNGDIIKAFHSYTEKVISSGSLSPEVGDEERGKVLARAVVEMMNNPEYTTEQKAVVYVSAYSHEGLQEVQNFGVAKSMDEAIQNAEIKERESILAEAEKVKYQAYNYLTKEDCEFITNVQNLESKLEEEREREKEKEEKSNEQEVQTIDIEND